jgi:hypothetical protein
MKIERDKWKHFWVGLALGFVLQLIMISFLSFPWVWESITVLFLVVGASYGFELISLVTGKGHYDVIDAVAGVIGGIIGQVIALVLEWI